jgi:hypothetical protein
LGVARVGSDKLGLAVDNHLGSEGRFAFEMGDVLLLAEGPVRRGIGIDPAIVIPVVDVFLKADDVGAGDRLEGFEFAEKGVGRGAGGAAFGGEEFDENGGAIELRGGGLRCGRAGWIWIRGCEQERGEG